MPEPRCNKTDCVKWAGCMITLDEPHGAHLCGDYQKEAKMPENVTTEQMLFEIDDFIERAESLFEQAKRSRVKWAIDKSKKLLDVRRAILARLSQMSAETGECPICKIHGEKVRCMRCGKDFYWANILQFCENCTSQTKPTAGTEKEDEDD